MLLLGAGASVSAGVPSAWDVLMELSRRLARQEGHALPAGPDAPHQWYRNRFEEEPRYDRLIEAFAKTPAERQQLLRQFFEPTDAEREAGLKRPSTGHKAIAQLVGSGHLRVIVTLNFDRLIEQALRAADIEPTVVATPEDAEGLAPVHTHRALVVHLHGDYLNPASMLNTETELAGYHKPMRRLLRTLLRNYGLIAVGWSGIYDTALRKNIKRTPNPHSTGYWVDPYPLKPVAEDLRVNKRYQYVPRTADDFLGRLADAVTALDMRNARHPLDMTTAVATAKRHLAGTQPRSRFTINFTQRSPTSTRCQR